MSDFGQQPPQEPGQPLPPPPGYAPPPPGYMPPPPPSYQSYAQPAMPVGSMAQQIVKASFWNRAGATLIDSLVMFALILPIVGLLIAAGSEAGFFLFLILIMVIGLLYGPFFESRPAGATPGKMVTGTRVVKLETGARLTLGQAMVRQLCKFLFSLIGNIPFVGWIVNLLNYLSMLWDPAKMTWHDKMSKTVVVPKSVYPPTA
jgi:uncharacterized RDD family membrane protein YckC